jgi:hypothetical protein
MVCCTSHNVIKLWDISRREPKTIVPGRQFATQPAPAAGQEETPPLGGAAGMATPEAELKGIHIRSLSINCTGTKIGLIANRIDEEHGAIAHPDSRLHVYDVELDKVFSYQFGPKFYPVRMHWDSHEPKLLAVESKKFESENKDKDKDKDDVS